MFLDYVTVNYVDPDEALFPIELWNQYEENDNKRTNNDAESYNLWLDLWLHKHPNIWNFITKIKAEESSANLKYIRINDGTFKRRFKNLI